MKRVISFVSGVAAVMAVVCGQAMAEPGDPRCVDGEFCVSTDLSDAGAGNPLAALTSKGPFHGILAIGSTEGDTPGLYLILDGYQRGNYDPLDGYIGLNTGDLDHALLGLVGDDHGNFERGEQNRALIELLQTFTPTFTPEAVQTYMNLAHLSPGLNFLTLPGAGSPAMPNPQTDVLQPILVIFQPAK